MSVRLGAYAVRLVALTAVLATTPGMIMALPFTTGPGAGMEVERVDRGGKRYSLITFVSEGERQPSILFGDTTFRGDRIIYDEFLEQATAIGNVHVILGSQLLHGEHLEYSFTTRRGMLTSADMQSRDIHVVGGKIEIREVNITDRTGTDRAYSYEIHEGTITACEHTVPHYHFESELFRVIPDVRVWLYSAVYRVTGIPAFYFPYLTRSLRKEPFAYVFEPGYDSNKGFTVLNRWHFHYQDILHPMARATLYTDVFSRQGAGVGGKWTYLRQPEADSYLHGYYIDQRNDFNEDINARVNTKGSRGKVAFQHFQRLGKEWTVTAKGRRLSDPDFDEDYADEEIKREFTNEELESDRDAFVNVRRAKNNSNFRVIYKERLEDFNLLDVPEDERQEVVYDSKRRPFTGTNIYHRYKLSAGHYKSHQTTDVGNINRINSTNLTGRNDADIEQELSRADIQTELSRPFPFETFTLIPFVGYEGTAYSDANRKTRVWTHKGENLISSRFEEYNGLFRHVASGGVEFSTRRAFHFDDPSKAIERRLLVEPNIKLVAHLPNEEFEDLHPDRDRPPVDTIINQSNSPLLNRRDRPGFPEIDEIDALRDEFAGFELRLETRLQTRQAGRTPRDILVGAVSTAVDFTETQKHEQQFQTLFGEIFYYPTDWLEFTGFIEYEPEGSFVRSLRNSATWSPNDRLSLSVAYSQFKFDADAKKAEEELAMLLDYRLSDRYTVSYEERYDLDDNLSRRRQIGVIRDFHDWILNVGFRQSQRESRKQSIGTYFTLTFKAPKGLQDKLPTDTPIQGDAQEGLAVPNS